MTTCSLCGGGGFFAERVNKVCTSCGGSGRSHGATCKACGGLGHNDTAKYKPCPNCAGTGLSVGMKVPIQEPANPRQQASIPTLEIKPARPTNSSPRSSNVSYRKLEEKPRPVRQEEKPVAVETNSSSYVDGLFSRFPRSLSWLLAIVGCVFAVTQSRKYGLEDYQVALWGVGGLVAGLAFVPLLQELVKLTVWVALIGIVIAGLYGLYIYVT